MSQIGVAVLVLVAVVAVSESAGCIGPKTPDELLSTLLDTAVYGKHTRPNEAAALAAQATSDSAQPDVIRLEFRIDALANVNEKRGEISLVVSRKAYWTDTRLRFNGSESGGCVGSKLEFPGPPLFWVPHIYYMNIVKHGDVIGESNYIKASGEVRWYVRQHLTFSCKMQLARMPYDVHECRNRISTFAGNENTLQLSFEGEGVETPKFDVFGDTAEWKMDRVFGEVFDHAAFGDDDTALDFVVVIGRDTSYYTYYVILPAFLVVCMSYASFYISRQAAPARGGAAIVCFLTLANMINGVRSSLPKARSDESIVLLDVLSYSLYMCFYTVLEFGFGNWMARAVARIEKFKKETAEVRAAGEEGQQEETQKRFARSHTIRKVGLCTHFLMHPNGTILLRENYLDRFSRICFPPVYIIGLVILVH